MKLKRLQLKKISLRFEMMDFYYFFLGFCLMGRGIQYAFSSIFGATFNMFYVGVPLFVIAMLSLASRNAFRVNRGNLLIFFGTLVAYGFSVLTCGDLSGLLDVFGDFVQVCLLLIIGCFFTVDFEKLIRSCRFFSYITVIIYEYMIVSGNPGIRKYMTFGYNFLLAVSFLAIYAFMNKKKLLFVLTIVLSSQVLMYGPRMGWFLVAILYLGIVLVKVKKMILRIILTVAAAFGIVNYQTIINYVIDLLVRYTNTSTLTMQRIKISLEGGDSAELLIGARYLIYMKSLEMIKEYPLFGAGIGGLLKKSGMMFTYPHNIFLEMLLDFGVVMGGALIVFVFWVIIRSLIDAVKVKNDAFLLVMIWLLLNFLRLIVSQSYVCESIFFAVICLAMNFLSNVNLTAGEQLKSIADAASDSKRENFSFRQKLAPQ